jgi:catechol 2,3-dioxygenase-like lactoylglutathione lyase family enzyme
MLGNQKIIGMVPISDPDRARAFYVEKLGLRFVSDDGFAIVLDANGNMLRLTRMREVKPQPLAVLGWEVVDIGAAIRQLRDVGVVFESYHDFMKQDELGIWTAPDGTCVAWFKDPDGNILSLSQRLVTYQPCF